MASTAKFGGERSGVVSHRGATRGGQAIRTLFGDPLQMVVAVVLFLIVQREFFGFPYLFTIFGFNLWTIDVAVAICGVSFFVYSLSAARFDTIKCAVLVLIAVVLYSIFRGVCESPFRAFFVFRDRIIIILMLALVVFFRTQFEYPKTAMKLHFIAIIMLLCLIVLRSVFGTSYLLDAAVSLLEQQDEARVITAYGAMYLVLVLILILDKLNGLENRREVWLYRGMAFLAVALLIISRQRTSCLAGLVGGSVYFLSNEKFVRRHPLTILSAVLLLLLCVIFYFSGGLDELGKMLPSSFLASFQKANTLEGRQYIWAYVTSQQFASWDFHKQLFGIPAGEAILILSDKGTVWEHSVHNQYIATLLDYGIMGAIAWSVLLGASLLQAISHLGDNANNRVGLSAAAALAMLVAMLVFGYGYEWEDVIAIFLPAAVAGWGRKPQKRGVRLAAVR